MTFKKKGDKARYSFLDSACIGRECWMPGMYQHRSMLAGGGSRNTGSPDSPCCMRRAYHGCPSGPVGERKEFDSNLGCEVTVMGLPLVNIDLTKQRKAQGWRAA